MSLPCRCAGGHHREVRRSGDETIWWESASIDPTVTARAPRLQTHPLSTNPTSMVKNSDARTPGMIGGPAE
jgi:hypothetical protein